MEPAPQNVNIAATSMLLWVMILAGIVAVSGLRIWTATMASWTDCWFYNWRRILADSKNRITWWDAAFRQMLRVVGCWQCGNKTNIYYYYLYCPSTRLGTWLRQFVGQWRCWGVCLSLMQRGRVWGACSLLSGINCIFDFPSPRLLEIYI